MRVSGRVANLPPYIFAQVGRRIAEAQARGTDVINLGIGSPDLPPSGRVIEALYRSALNPGHHGYSGYYGIPALREAIGRYYRTRFGVTLDSDEEILPLLGSKEGIANITLAFVDPGDVVLVPDPGYPTYRMGALLAGGTAYSLRLLPEHDYLPDFSSVPDRVISKSKLLWLNYPNNPTGATADTDFFAYAIDFAKERDLLLCHDNPYCDVTFDGYVAPSILQLPGAKDVCIEFNSLSKTYNMAGWRVGMAVGNRKAVDALGRVKTNVDSGMFRAVQDAAIAALEEDQTWLAERNAIYQGRRDIVMDFLPRAGMAADPPKAALYVWARIPQTEECPGYSWRILEETGVWLTPGTAFGELGKKHIRISLTVAEDRLREAGRRLASLQHPPGVNSQDWL